MNVETAGRRLAEMIDSSWATVGDPRRSRKVTIASLEADVIVSAAECLETLGIKYRFSQVRGKGVLNITGRENFAQLFGAVAEHLQDAAKRGRLEALASMGRPGRPREHDAEQVAQAAAMRSGGMSLRRIGAALDLPKSTVERMLQEQPP